MDVFSLWWSLTPVNDTSTQEASVAPSPDTSIVNLGGYFIELMSKCEGLMIQLSTSAACICM